MPSVRVEQVEKRFGATAAVSGVSLEVRAGEFFTLLGPSGCGKTTLLRLIAGLESPDNGTIHFGDNRIDQVPTHLRRIGMVFQNYALFPHMSVAENIAYGLQARKFPAREIPDRVAEALRMVQMEEFGPRSPSSLSGGQQQRVALARALAPRPAILLMDEPLANLDARLRLGMRAEIRRLQRQVGITTIYVTHDQEEALAISDRVGVMEGGVLKQVGSPTEVYKTPCTREVAEFVGTCSLLLAEVREGEVRFGTVRFSAPTRREHQGSVWVGLRPESVRPLRRAAGSGVVAPGRVALDGEVLETTFLGASSLVTARLRSGEIIKALTADGPDRFPAGADVALHFHADEALLFDGLRGGALR